MKLSFLISVLVTNILFGQISNSIENNQNNNSWKDEVLKSLENEQLVDLEKELQKIGYTIYTPNPNSIFFNEKILLDVILGEKYKDLTKHLTSYYNVNNNQIFIYPTISLGQIDKNTCKSSINTLYDNLSKKTSIDNKDLMFLKRCCWECLNQGIDFGIFGGKTKLKLSSLIQDYSKYGLGDYLKNSSRTEVSSSNESSDFLILTNQNSSYDLLIKDLNGQKNNNKIIAREYVSKIDSNDYSKKSIVDSLFDFYKQLENINQRYQDMFSDKQKSFRLLNEYNIFRNENIFYLNLSKNYNNNDLNKLSEKIKKAYDFKDTVLFYCKNKTIHFIEKNNIKHKILMQYDTNQEKLFNILFDLINKQNKDLILTEKEKQIIFKKYRNRDSLDFVNFYKYYKLNNTIKSLKDKYIFPINENFSLITLNKELSNFGYLIFNKTKNYFLSGIWPAVYGERKGQNIFPDKILEISLDSSLYKFHSLNQESRIDFFQNKFIEINSTGFYMKECDKRFNICSGLELKFNTEYYMGDYKNGAKSGFGFEKTKDKIYSGNFENNSKNGLGKEFYTNKDFYEGNFKNGIKDGYGKFVYANGLISEGLWQNDLLYKTKVEIENEQLAEKQRLLVLQAEESRLREIEKAEQAKKDKETEKLLKYLLLTAKQQKPKKSENKESYCYNCGRSIKHGGWKFSNKYECEIKKINKGDLTWGDLWGVQIEEEIYCSYEHALQMCGH